MLELVDALLLKYDGVTVMVSDVVAVVESGLLVEVLVLGQNRPIHEEVVETVIEVAGLGEKDETVLLRGEYCSVPVDEIRLEQVGSEQREVEDEIDEVVEVEELAVIKGLKIEAKEPIGDNTPEQVKSVQELENVAVGVLKEPDTVKLVSLGDNEELAELGSVS